MAFGICQSPNDSMANRVISLHEKRDFSHNTLVEFMIIG